MEEKNLTIVIYSCWKNSDMWDVFSALFKKYWSDCTYDIVSLTDKIEEKKENWVFTKIVEYDSTWGKMILNVLSIIDSKYVSLWMDDYLLCDYVDNESVEICIEHANRLKTGLFRFGEATFSKMQPYQNGGNGFYEILPQTAYSISTQIGIWNIDYLKKYVKKEWSAWDFERIGSFEIDDKNMPIIYWNGYEIPYIEGVRQGKWMMDGAKLCRRNQIAIDTNRRPVMNQWEMAKVYIKGSIIEKNPNLILKLQNRINEKK